MTDRPVAPIVYVDANPFIYFIDGEEAVANRWRPFFELLLQNPGAAITSELTLAEVLAKALPDARRSYLNLIVWSSLIQLQPVTREILIDTADYRRVSQRLRPDRTISTVRLPDAIHVVTAIQSRCSSMFFSADSGVRLPSGMTILEPNETGISALRRVLA
jgi:predicted nucleic acid-binding protein